ncbi:S-adenosylhomocysteine deaminase [Candidatus Bathyarchaeota archaeon]|nr:MAG: S-adenosylhomocysteine deaminase [Candidatus Bathyarchaeota archaeon]
MLLRAEWVVPVSRPPIRDGAVLVEGPLIEAVGPYEAVKKEAGRDDVLDLGQAIIMPGLVNAHSHVVYTVLRGLEDDLTLFGWLGACIIGPSELLSERDFLWSARLGCLEAVRAGITCLADAAPFGSVVLRAMAESGLRGLVFREVFEGEEAGGALESALREIEEMEKAAPERIKIGISPHSPYANPPGFLRSVAEAARERELPVSLHLAETKAEYEFFTEGKGELTAIADALGLRLPKAIGKTPTEYLAELELLGPDVLLAHCIHLTGRDVELIARSGSSVAHCPKSNAKLGSGIAKVPELLSAGVKVGLGTDSAASNNVLDMFEEMRMAVFLQRASRTDAPVLTAEDALHMATLGGAEALGLNGLIGSLEPGKRADLVAVRLHEGLLPIYGPVSALVFCANRSDVVLTMVDGEALFLDGRFTKLDAERIIGECRSIGERLAEELC